MCSQGGPKTVCYLLFLSIVIPWPLHFLFSFFVLFLSVYLSPRSGQSNSWLSSVELFGTWRSIFVLNLLTLSTLNLPEKTTLSTQFQGVGDSEKNGNCVFFCWSLNVVLQPLNTSPTTCFSISNRLLYQSNQCEKECIVFGGMWWWSQNSCFSQLYHWPTSSCCQRAFFLLIF